MKLIIWFLNANQLNKDLLKRNIHLETPDISKRLKKQFNYLG